MSHRATMPITKFRLEDLTAQAEADRQWYKSLTPEQRLAMVQQLTDNAWAFHPVQHEPRLPRHTARLTRRTR